MDKATNIHADYITVLNAHWVRLSKVTGMVALLLMPAGVSLDYYVYPDYYKFFFFLRMSSDVIIVICLAIISFTVLGKKHVRIITFIYLIAIQAVICHMIYVTEGANSVYYAGLNLAVIGVGIVLPLTPQESTFFGAVTLLLYVITCLTHQQTIIDASIFYNNVYFLVLTGFITALATYFNSRSRFTEFRLRYELDNKNKKMEELDQQKTIFFANISHELRTPLTLILAPLNDLLSGTGKLSDKATKLLLVARDNGLRLLKLVNDLLDVIRLEEGKLDLKHNPIDLNVLVPALVDSMTHLAERDSKQLIVNLGKQPLVVSGDQSALEKIFLNLIGNAIKFTNDHGKILVSGKQQGDQIVIKVQDTGIGIDDEHLPFVFDRFRQVDGSATRRYQGTGLGLALVKELTEQQGGLVEIKSQPGEGTTVSIKLPMSCEVMDSSLFTYDFQTDIPTNLPTKSNDAIAASTLPIMVRNEIAATADYAKLSDQHSVLIVDDETDMRQYLVNLMSSDYRILQAVDGKQGLEIAEKDLPDLVLLDMMLPEINGLDVCKRLKDNSQTNHIKIVLLTAKVDESSKLTALENGADDFLTKPFSSIEVRVRVSNLLRTAALQKNLKSRNQDLQNTLHELKDTQSQLIQSEKLNALGTLAAGLLHELNNPLNYSMTAIQLVKNEPLVKKDEFLLEAIQDIDEGMERIKSIVTDLRAFAYPSSIDSMQRFDLCDALQNALRYTSHELKDIRVEQSVEQGTMVYGSQTHLIQVVVNLLLNAAKAVTKITAERLGLIRIQCIKKNKRLFVKIYDNGCGMSEDVQERVFEPFYTTQDVGQGMGLGLSICHTIISNFGGSLDVASKEGEWCEFTFDLPLAIDG